jgi:hypothetical protein
MYMCVYVYVYVHIPALNMLHVYTCMRVIAESAYMGCTYFVFVCVCVCVFRIDIAWW